MQNTERRKYATEKICAVLGVPKVQLGYTEGVNFSNATQQYTKFIENTIRPLERWLKTVFDTLILEDFGETKVEFMINDTHIDDIEQKSKIAQSNVSQGYGHQTRRASTSDMTCTKIHSRTPYSFLQEECHLSKYLQKSHQKTSLIQYKHANRG